MPILKHTHQLERIGKRPRHINEGMWRCWHPDCTFKIPAAEVEGKRSQCGCGNDFIIDSGAKQRKRPKCINCRGTKEGKQHRRIVDILEEVLEVSE
ncbi:MAG: hypothetical protein KGI50_06800 [Patescibacteria group bacterium]|nr:hypothetical protein [Patescibacteria group bacterium]MDE2439231.1 hypothetical protein [Patescibacteria group bacterium]